MCLASGYAAADAKTIWPKVPAAVINTVLKIYLENGTQELFMTWNRSPKFSNVGFLTNSVGGKTNSSSSGLNALLIT
ncbi:hypothetical protein D3C79_1086980 [compost metagenome]